MEFDLRKEHRRYLRRPISNLTSCRILLLTQLSHLIVSASKFIQARVLSQRVPFSPVASDHRPIRKNAYIKLNVKMKEIFP